MMKKKTFWLKLGSSLWILTAAAHTLGQLSGLEPTNESEENLLTLLNTQLINVGGMERTLGDFMNGFSWTMTAALVFAGVLTIRLARSESENASLLRTLTLMDLVFAGALFLISVVYFHYPPMATLGMAFVCYLVALMLRGDAARPS